MKTLEQSLETVILNRKADIKNVGKNHKDN